MNLAIISKLRLLKEFYGEIKIPKAPPKWSPAALVNLFKGASSRKLRQEFPSLKKVHREKLWTRTYYVGTAGNVSSETIQRYIEECQD